MGPEGVFELTPDHNGTIKHGDLLHVDFGVTAMGMNTDTQHLAYVLYPGETEKDIPRGLLDGLKKANRLQDIVKENMEIGLTGNVILKKSLAQMKSEGFGGAIYSHPIGDWGHSAGTLIGMFYQRPANNSCINTDCLRYDKSSRRSGCSWRLATARQHILQCGTLRRAFCPREERNTAFLPGGRCVLG